jgi:hypothetical protein
VVHPLRLPTPIGSLSMKSALADRLHSILEDAYRTIIPIEQPYIDLDTWKPQEPYFRLLTDYPHVYFGNFRTYVTNARPTVEMQLRRCLQHFNRIRRDTPFFGSGYAMNYVTRKITKIL